MRMRRIMALLRIEIICRYLRWMVRRWRWIRCGSWPNRVRLLLLTVRRERSILARWCWGRWMMVQMLKMRVTRLARVMSVSVGEWAVVFNHVHPWGPWRRPCLPQIDGVCTSNLGHWKLWERKKFIVKDRRKSRKNLTIKLAGVLTGVGRLTGGHVRKVKTSG